MGRLALTGFGLVSAAGIGVNALRHALIHNEKHLGPLPPEVARGMAVREGGSIPNPDRSKASPHADRAFLACRLAAEEALGHANLDKDERDRTIGFAFGTALGSMELAQETLFGARRGKPDLVTVAPQLVGDRLARDLNLRGPATTFSATCVSSLYALEQAAQDLELARADAMLCGGVDLLSRFMQAGFCLLGALTGVTSSRGESRPFLLGEAACFVVLETLAKAKSRGAIVHGVLNGRALRADALHPTAPDPEGKGMKRAIHACLADAGRKATEIGSVSVTANASPLYQTMYGNVLAEIFENSPIAIESWEPAVGHVLAASGVLGLVHSALGFERDSTRSGDALALTVGFGGQNGATLLGRPESEYPSIPRARSKPTPLPIVGISGIGVASEAPRDLEDLFPGRWNPRRELDRNTALLLDAERQAVTKAGWWTNGSGEPVSGGQVIGVDFASLEPSLRFGRILAEPGESSGNAASPSDFLFALPSSPAALAGVALGLDRYQATVTELGMSGFQALAHGAELLRSGRLKRVVVAALSHVGPEALPVLDELGIVASGEEPFALAVALCLEALDPTDAKSIKLPVLEETEVWRPPSEPRSARFATKEPTLVTSSLLGDLPQCYRSLAAPSLLALTKWIETRLNGPHPTRQTILHLEPRLEAVGAITIMTRW